MWMFFILSICAKFFIKKGASAPFLSFAPVSIFSVRHRRGASRPGSHDHPTFRGSLPSRRSCSRGLFSFLRFDMQGNKIACSRNGNKNDNKPGDVDALLSGHFPVYVFHVGFVCPVRTAVHIVCHIIQHSVYHGVCIVLIDPAAGGKPGARLAVRRPLLQKYSFIFVYVPVNPDRKQGEAMVLLL